MKKLIAVLIVCLMLLFSVGCQEIEINKETISNSSMFVLVEETTSWRVVYHKETKVMYAVSFGYKNSGTFTLLVDKDGKPLLWQGE